MTQPGGARDDRRRARAHGGRRRSAARLAAAQALYQIELGGGSVEEVVQDFIRHRLAEIAGQGFVPADEALFADIVRGAARRRDELDNMIAGVLAEPWRVDRLETILHVILRAAAYELSARPDVPPRVTVNEYVDLADAFFGGKETALVNGVLDRLARALRPDEMDARARG
ncbi:MAG: transcription antitermination factor NusB [Rhodospirillaceae bacterium]|nr:transcription antitermination factor NusB [Rhodospirillaceae bacterium]